MSISAPSTDDVAGIVKRVRKGVLRLLGRNSISPGRDGDDGWDDPLAEENPALAAVSAASIQQLSALEDRAGKRTRRLGEEPDDSDAQPRRRPQTLGSRRGRFRLRT